MVILSFEKTLRNEMVKLKRGYNDLILFKIILIKLWDFIAML